MEKRSKLKTGFNIIVLIVLLIALFMYVVILFNTITNKEVTLNFFHWKPFIVVSDSAEAGVNAGDLAVIKDIKIEDIKPGDIIVYRRGNNGAIKKVKEIRTVNGERKIVIEDDSIIKNESINSSIEGKYMFKIAGLGNVMLFLQTPLGGIVLFSIFMYIVLIIKVIDSKSSKEEVQHVKKDEVEEKIEENFKKEEIEKIEKQPKDENINTKSDKSLNKKTEDDKKVSKKTQPVKEKIEKETKKESKKNLNKEIKPDKQENKKTQGVKEKTKKEVKKKDNNEVKIEKKKEQTEKASKSKTKKVTNEKEDANN